MENLGINPGFLLIQIVNFFVIFFVLKVWVYTPLTRMLEKRRKMIAQGLEDARVAAEARSNAEREANRVITEAQVKANDILREADERSEAIKHNIVATAEAEATKKRDMALIEIDQDRNRMLAELRSDVITLAMAATQKLIQCSLSEEYQRSLLNEFFSGIRDGHVLVLAENHLKGKLATVTSALPLTGDEKALIQYEVQRKLGSDAAVTFRTDHTILGGVVLQVGDRVLDGSIAGQLQELEQSLQ